MDILTKNVIIIAPCRVFNHNFLVAFTHAPDTHLHMITMGKVHVNTKCQVSTFSLRARILFIYLFILFYLFI